MSIVRCKKSTSQPNPNAEGHEPTVIVIKTEAPKPVWEIIKLSLILIIIIVIIAFPEVIEVIKKLLL